MREMRFRGWSEATQCWEYGSGIDVRSNKDICILNSDLSGCDVSHTVNPRSVSQFTGRLDSNNRTIYEGDIIRVLDYEGDIAGGNLREGLVRWDEKKLAYVVSFGDGEVELFGEEYTDFYTVHIIGNEFEQLIKK